MMMPRLNFPATTKKLVLGPGSSKIGCVGGDGHTRNMFVMTFATFGHVEQWSQMRIGRKRGSLS